MLMTLVLAAMGVALALLLVSALEVLPPVSRTATRSFWCPFSERDVTVSLRGGVWEGRAEDVVSCSAFVPSTGVTCAKLCLHVDKLASLKPAA